MLANFWDVKFLWDLSPKRLDKLKTIKADRCEYSRGAIIRFDQDSIDAVGFVLNGVLKTAQYTNTGKEINNHYFCEGDILPEYMVLSGIHQYVYNLVCVKQAVVDWLPLDQFNALISSDIEIVKNLLGYVAKRGYQSELLLHCLHYHRISERLAYYLLNTNLEKKNGWIQVPFSQKVLADKLNVTRSVLNQELINFEQSGWIERNKNQIKILTPDQLEDFL